MGCRTFAHRPRLGRHICTVRQLRAIRFPRAFPKAARVGFRRIVGPFAAAVSTLADYSWLVGRIIAGK